MKIRHQIAWLVLGTTFGSPLAAQEVLEISDAGPQPAPSEEIDLSKSSAGAFPEDIDLTKSDARDSGDRALRFSLGHEGAYKAASARGVVNNRSSFRVELSKFFFDRFFVQLDTKLNMYLGSDHRARAEDKRIAFENLTPEAFVQYSPPGTNASIKLGVQKLIWGVSEGGAITDEVSPRNMQELFFIPLEEARIGQFMLNVDNFSSVGQWSVFFAPDAQFNKLPERGTAYYVDPFNGTADIRTDSNEDRREYGARWKRTVGRSDISFMAASLIDNDYAYRADAVTDTGRLLVTRVPTRFEMVGTAFNYARGDFLFRGEVGYKTPKAFNDANLQIIERDIVDSSLGFTYSLGNSNTVGVEFVNRHVLGWTDAIQGVRQDTNSVVLNTTVMFLNDQLSINSLSIYSEPFTSFQQSFRTSYKWSDSLTLGLDVHFVDVPDRNSALWRFRDRDQVFFRLDYKF